MASLGYGYGDGYCYGYGSGSGDGSGDGDGYGYGAGDGYGDGSGYGYGYCDGYGHGLGCGSGYGIGDRYGVPVATLGEREVRAIISPWGRAASVGCLVHSLDTWRERWRAIAQEHGVTVTSEEVARLIALVEAAPMGPEWLPSEEDLARRAKESA